MKSAPRCDVQCAMCMVSLQRPAQRLERRTRVREQIASRAEVGEEEEEEEKGGKGVVITSPQLLACEAV